MMNRRELLKMIALVTGTAVVGADFFLTGCAPEKKETGERFTQDDVSLLDEVGETILPRTDTPGAKDAAIGMFMTVIVMDCYTAQDQKVFFEGMKQLNDVAKTTYGSPFMDLDTLQRQELLISLESEAKEYQVKVDQFNEKQNKLERDEFARGNLTFVKERMSTHYYIMLKQLTMWGFFTSEVGATQALRHVAVPGRYEGCIPYKKGDRAWG